MDGNDQSVVLLAATVWWPLSARLAIRLIDNGCRVAALCPRGHLLRHVTGIETIYPYSSLRSLASLEAAIKAAQPDLIVPCDDRVVWQLHELYKCRPALRPLIEASLGPASGYDIADSRERLLQVAQGLSIRVPETHCVTSEDDIHSWFSGASSSAVLKVDGSWGGEGVAIAHSEQQAIDGFRKLSERLGLGTAWKRLLVNRDPLSLWAWSKQTAPVITMQQFIAGRPANSMLACWRGELLGALSVEVVSSQGDTGAAIIVRIIENEEIFKAAKLLTSHLGLTGFYGLDFMLDHATGFAYLIEMNPRCTQLGHLPHLKQGGDLASLLYAKLTGGLNPSPQLSVENDIVAFFPQAISWNPNSRFIRDGYHDVPWEQPRLVRELLLEPWPERQWIARLYHAFRAPRKVAAMEFELSGSSMEPRKQTGPGALA